MSPKICTVEGCTTAALSRAMCVKHYHRWKQHGDPKICLKPTDPLGATGPCMVATCERDAATRRMCTLHYGRWRKHGDPLVTKPRRKRSCSLDECTTVALAKGLCSKHYARARTHGDPRAMAPSGRPIKGAEITHAGIHKRLLRQRGKAAAYKCVDCGGPANEWSYDNSDPEELQEYLGDSLCAYSLSLDHYEPRCTPCHRRFDLKARQLKDSPA
ncbi:hypothetical protein Leucomu_12995 [Leucobacter muris]|uniref:HNH endonuclease n=1 Tax=Leucobacter muris TaxID=1935379 RepID=A0ABX5QIC3_9MICO|nr:hypothetical protein [Leucobacter muris]QAB18703.1 hypothetical protein Leucomu_12995 [Leucobacter muris]